jgi:hypothetical protein
LALTRPKTPKKEQSGSPPGSNRERQCESLRSPATADGQHSHSRSSSKTPIHINSGDGSENPNIAGDMNSSMSSSKFTSTPVPSNEKLNHHIGDNPHNNGMNNNHNQQFPSHINGPEKILPSPSVDRKDFDVSKMNCEYIYLNLLELNVLSGILKIKIWSCSE